MVWNNLGTNSLWRETFQGHQIWPIVKGHIGASDHRRFNFNQKCMWGHIKLTMHIGQSNCLSCMQSQFGVLLCIANYNLLCSGKLIFIKLLCKVTFLHIDQCKLRTADVDNTCCSDGKTSSTCSLVCPYRDKFVYVFFCWVLVVSKKVLQFYCSAMENSINQYWIVVLWHTNILMASAGWHSMYHDSGCLDKASVIVFSTIDNYCQSMR